MSGSGVGSAMELIVLCKCCWHFSTYRLHLSAQEVPYALQSVSRKYPQCCFWNSSNIRVVDGGPFLSSHLVGPAARWVLVLYLRIVSQAPQHFWFFLPRQSVLTVLGAVPTGKCSKLLNISDLPLGHVPLVGRPLVLGFAPGCLALVFGGPLEDRGGPDQPAVEVVLPLSFHSPPSPDRPPPCLHRDNTIFSSLCVQWKNSVSKSVGQTRYKAWTEKRQRHRGGRGFGVGGGGGGLVSKGRETEGGGGEKGLVSHDWAADFSDNVCWHTQKDVKFSAKEWMAGSADVVPRFSSDVDSAGPLLRGSQWKLPFLSRQGYRTFFFLSFSPSLSLSLSSNGRYVSRPLC